MAAENNGLGRRPNQGFAQDHGEMSACWLAASFGSDIDRHLPAEVARLGGNLEVRGEWQRVPAANRRLWQSATGDGRDRHGPLGRAHQPYWELVSRLSANGDVDVAQPGYHRDERRSPTE